jgi:ribosome-associated protein
MTPRASLDDVRSWSAAAARAAASKGGEDPVVLAVGDLISVADAFVITNGTNPRQVKAIVDAVEEQVKAAGGDGPLRVEGLDDASWVLMDFGDLVVHVFGAEERNFYALEGLWADADRWAWQPEVAGVD